jgi:soluble lytic murein transglycosylase-like protein
MIFVRRKIIWFLLSLCAALTISVEAGRAASPPHTYGLKIAKNTDVIDPSFAEWFKRYAEVPSVDEDPEGFQAYMRSLSPLQQKLIATMTSQKSHPLSQGEPAILNSIKAELTSGKTYALLPELASELLQNETWDESSTTSLEDIRSKSSPTSCYEKLNLLDQISGMATQDRKILNNYLDVIATYKSAAHRRRAIDRFASVLPESRREEFRPAIGNMLKDFPNLRRKFKWLSTKNDDDEEPVTGLFGDVIKEVRRRNCHQGQAGFTRILKSSPPAASYSEAKDAGLALERCIRSGSRQAGSVFWKDLQPTLESAYGKQGFVLAELRLGYLLWAADKNEEARQVYLKILSSADANAIDKATQAKATHTLGKIAENMNDLSAATDYYGKYIRDFSDQEDFESALNSMVIVRASQKQWQALIPALETYLNAQSLVHIDQRPVGAMAFSLFWLGRSYLTVGQVALAKEMWRRLSMEYYSTFYGAVAHHLLEQAMGQKFAMEPSRVAGFDMDKLIAELEERHRPIVRRSIEWLALGQKELARCELEELDPSTGAKELLAKALLLHASGSWLEAIKVYDGLPRSLRNALPAGFERILFPRKYGDLVVSYAKKAKLDPDLAFAVMRQESVFAKDATSPVGAMGLMQLMPSTARLELRKLGKHYIPASKRQELTHALQSDSSLRDPETNIILGVHHLARLLSIYKSPVFALTSYNASPAATIKWQRTIPTDDWLTFIERIPYKETRAYVKLILRNYFYYKRWYNSDVKTEAHLEAIIVDLAKTLKTTVQQADHREASAEDTKPN